MEINVKLYDILFVRRNFLKVLESIKLGIAVKFSHNADEFFIISKDDLNKILSKCNMEIQE